MINIKIRYFGFFEDLVGLNEEVIGVNQKNFCVKDLIDLLSKKYGHNFKNTLIDSGTNDVREGCILLLNNMKGNLDERIKDGDVIFLLPILAGG